MTPEEARVRLLEGLDEFDDAIYAYPTAGSFSELTERSELIQAMAKHWAFFAGEPHIDAQSPTDVDAGTLVALYLPWVDGDALVMADISLKWDPNGSDAATQLARYQRWAASFRAGLKGGTRWRFLGYKDNPPAERETNERFSPGALDFHRRGGRWVQRWIPNQEWIPPDPPSGPSSAPGDIPGH